MRLVILLVLFLFIQTFGQSQNISLSKLIGIPQKSRVEISTFLESNKYYEQAKKNNIAKADTLNYWNQSKGIFPFICQIIYPQGITNKSTYEIFIDIEDSLTFTTMMEKEIKKMGFKIYDYYRFDNTVEFDIDLFSKKSIVTVVEYKKGDESIRFRFQEKTIMIPMISYPSNCKFEELSFRNYYTIIYEKNKPK